MLTKFPSDKTNVSKNELFLPWRAPTHHRFTFNSSFLYEPKHKVRLSKSLCGIFDFRFRVGSLIFDFVTLLDVFFTFSDDAKGPRSQNTWYIRKGDSLTY